MTNDMWFSENPPTVPGWYWVRRHNSLSVLYFPHHGLYPRHWKQVREETLSALEDTQRALSYAAIDTKHFVVEYCGPIYPPANS